MSGQHDGNRDSGDKQPYSAAEVASFLSTNDDSDTNNQKKASDDGLATSDDDKQCSVIIKTMTASALSTVDSETNQNKVADDDELSTSDDDKHYAEILRAMTCFKCQTLMEPPVYENSAFEKICSGCYGNIKRDTASCESCKPPRTMSDYDRRILEALVGSNSSEDTCETPCPSHETWSLSLQAESLSEFIFYPCRYVGCDATVKLAGRKEHESSCIMRLVSCSQCSWQWALHSFKEHTMSKHASCLVARAQSDTGVPFAVHKTIGNQRQEYWQIYDEKLFKIICQRRGGDAYSFWVQCYGSPGDAKPYRFDFQLESSGWTIRIQGGVISDLERMPDDRMVIEKSLLKKIELPFDKSISVKFKITDSLCDAEAQGK